MHPLLLFLLLLLGCAPSFAQGDIEMNFDLYGQNEGLSSVWITDMVQDKNGFVWLGTYDGLNRFDGRNFKVYRHKPDDSTSLISNNGQKFFTDQRGRIWITYAEGGISRFIPEKQQFIHYLNPVLKPVLNLDRDFVLCHVDADENLWYSGKDMGLRCFNPKTGKHTIFNLPVNNASSPESEGLKYPNSIYFIYADKNGLFWLGTRSGLFSFDPISRKFNCFEHVTKGDKIRSDDFMRMQPDGDKGLWLSARQGGLSYFDFKTHTFRYYPLRSGRIGHYDLIHEICPRNADEFWVTSLDRGLGVFNKINGTYTFQPGRRANSVSEFVDVIRMLALPSGQLLLGDEVGLYVHNPQALTFQFKRLQIKESQHGDLFPIRRILENPSRHEMYFATDMGNGLNILNTQTGALQNLPVDTEPGGDALMHVRGMLRDKSGLIWLLSANHLYRFDETRKKLISMQPEKQSKLYGRAAKYKSFCTDNFNRLYLLNNAGQMIRFQSQTGLWDTLPGFSASTLNVQFILADQSNNLWLATSNGIYRYELAGNKLHTLKIDGMPRQSAYTIRVITADPQGNIWVAVNQKGLLRISHDAGSPVYRWFGIENGHHLDRIVRMNCDPKGYLWMATITSVLRMDTRTFSVRPLREYHGMDYTTLGMHFLTGDNGNFYIATPGKYCKVDFDLLDKKPLPPKVYIDHFSIYNNDIPVEPFGTILPEIKASEQYFAFEFGCIDFNNQQFHRFAYKLEGWDKDWILSGNRRYAGYTNLAGGKYTLLVKVANDDGVWSDVISVPVNIQTPFYKQAWFLAVLIFLITCVIYLLYSLRIRAIRRTEALKTQFNRQIAETRMEALRAQMNPHFIFNSLNSINRYIVRNDVKTSSLYLTRFAKLIRSVLDNSRHKVISLSKELDALRMYMEMEAFRFEKKFNYNLQVSHEIDPESIDVPPLIIQPYVENAIWHGLLHKEEEGQLDIAVNKEAGMLRIDITDNGIGREKAREFKSRNAPTRESAGLLLTGERIRLATGDPNTPDPEIIDRYDTDGKPAGTQVIIRIPMEMPDA